MRMPQVMNPHGRVDARSQACGLPEVVAEPLRRQVAVSLANAWRSRFVETVCATLGAVGRERLAAVDAPTLACGVGAERAVPVGPTALVRPGRPEVFDVDESPSGWCREEIEPEQQVIEPEAVAPDGNRLVKPFLRADPRSRVPTASPPRMWSGRSDGPRTARTLSRGPARRSTLGGAAAGLDPR